MLFKRLILLIGIGIYCSQISSALLNAKQLHSVCGQPGLWERVLGGKDSEMLPWLVAIFHKRTSASLFCEAALISELYAMTASHCLVFQGTMNKIPASDLQLRLGKRNLNSLSNGAVDYEVAKTIIHPDFDHKMATNDIGILKLKKCLNFTNAIKPICLPNTSDLINSNYKYEKPYLAGWGLTKIGGTTSPVLQKIHVYVAAHCACKKQYQDTVVQLTNKQFCTGYPKDGKDVCQGDSGGPVMVLNSHKQFAIIGVVSFGYKCGIAIYPSIHTRVASYLPWIMKTTGIK